MFDQKLSTQLKVLDKMSSRILHYKEQFKLYDTLASIHKALTQG